MLVRLYGGLTMKHALAPVLIGLLSTSAWGQSAPAQNSWVDQVLPPGATRPTAAGLHNCLDRYPADAKAAGIEGITSLSYRIADDGSVKNVSVLKSSGNVVLDKAAVACVKGWLYEPATLDEKPIEIPWRNDVKWVIAVNPPIAWPPSEVMPSTNAPLPANIQPPGPPPPPPVNTITVQRNVSSPPPISSPASIGRPHVCLAMYPADAQIEHAQGTVTVGFTITMEGTTGDHHIIKSSGYTALDDAAVACTVSWRYKPAVKDGQPIAVPWKAEVKWIFH